MDRRAEIVKTFLGKEVLSASNNFLSQVMPYLEKNKKGIVVDQFCQDFQELLYKCDMERIVGYVRCIQLSLVRAKALMGVPFYQLETFGDNFILEPPSAQMVMNLDWLYHSYQKFCGEITVGRKKYMQQILDSELSSVKLAQLSVCNNVVRYLFVEALPYIIDLPAFQRLSLEDDIQIQIGEFHGEYETIFITNAYTKK